MIQVEWNKEHTWKITKRYVNGKLYSKEIVDIKPIEDERNIHTQNYCVEYEKKEE